MVEEIRVKTSEKWIKILSVVFGIILIMVLIFFALAEIISLFWSFLIGIIIILICVSIFLFFHFLSKRKEIKEEIKTKKEIITLEQAREIAKRATQSPEYCDYNDDGLGEQILKLGPPAGEKVPIYIRKAIGEYTNDIYVVLINMINPEERDILINPTNNEIDRAAKLLAEVSLPEEEEELIKEYPTGVKEVTKRRLISVSEREKNEQKLKKEEI